MSGFFHTTNYFDSSVLLHVLIFHHFLLQSSIPWIYNNLFIHSPVFWGSFWPRYATCGISVPPPGVELKPWQFKCWILTTGLPWNSHWKQKRGLWRRTLVGIQTLVLSCFFPKRKGLSLTVPHTVNPPLRTEGVAMRTGSIIHTWDLIQQWTMWEKSQAQDTLSAGTGDGRGMRTGVTCVAASWVTAEVVWFGGWRQWQPACQASPVGWF